MKTIVTPVTNTNNLTTGVRNTAGFSSNNFGTVTSFSSGNFAPLFNTSVTLSNSTPALAFSAITQNANLFFAGPGSGGAAAPTFRALVSADFPTTLSLVLAGLSVPGTGTFSENFGALSTTNGRGNATALGNAATAYDQSVALGNSANAGAVSLTNGNVAIGYGAMANGGTGNNYSLAIGRSAQSISDGGTSIGAFSTTSGGRDFALGYSSNSTVSYGIAIGWESAASGGIRIGPQGNAATNGICIGGFNVSAAASQIILSTSNTSSNVWLGAGIGAAAAYSTTLHGTQPANAGVTGGNLILAGGLGGSAADAGGSVILQTAAAGAGHTLVNSLTVAPSGAVTIPGTLTLGGGTPMIACISVLATLAFPAVAATGGVQSLTVTVTGATVGNTVMANRADGLMPDAGTLLDAAVTSANTVTVRLTNVTAASISPISTSYRVTVLKF